jgi:hypothetical protein
MDVNRDLQPLVREIDALVASVSLSPLEDAEVRRTLRFLSQVIMVVEQAFQDVLALLVEVKYLAPSDLGTATFTNLRKQVDLLTARSHYRDAAEVCSRLRHLRSVFDDSVRPALDRLPHAGDWGGVLGLIEDREGRIILLIERTAHELEGLLASATPATLPAISATAATTATALRALLSELHELNGRILGFSGQAGLLELTRDRRQLERDVRIMVDQRDQSVTHGHRVQVGDHNTIDRLVTATTVQDSFNTVRESAVDAQLKARLTELCSQVETLLASAPGERRKEIEQDLSALVAEATRKEPRKRWYELSASGLVDAAKACAGAASPVIAAVTAVLAVLG